jgi:hypothetical protein
MTAPTVPGDAGSAPAEATPVDTGAYLDQLATEAAQAALPTDEVYEQSRDEKGRFTKVSEVETAEGEETPAPSAEAEAQAEAPSETDGDAATETPVVPDLPLADREPIVPLTVQVAGAEIKGLPDMTITYTTPGGKTRTDPLDKVVRLAADGIYSEQREQRFRSIEQQALQAQQELEAYKQELAQQNAYLEQLMTDENRYLNEKDVWDRMNTPEMRLQREREQLEAQRQQMELQRIASTGEQYFTQTLTPALDMIASAVPAVEPEELVAKVTLYVKQLEGRKGYLTPDQYNYVNQFLIEEVAPWAQSLNESRQEKWGKRSTPATAPAATPAETKAASVQTQKAKATVAKAMKPVGRGAAPAPKSRPAPTNVDDIMEDAVQSAIDAVLGA